MAKGDSPLCVEEFDLSDKNFRPCPCGYQVGLLSQQIVLIGLTKIGLPILLQQHQE